MQKGLWSNRNYILLFSAQIISLLGSGVTTVGLALFAYQLTGGASANAVIGNALFLRILAFLIFSQPAGVGSSIRTDKKGIAKIKIDGTGKWYVKFVNMTRISDPKVNYESRWATLTFEIR